MRKKVIAALCAAMCSLSAMGAAGYGVTSAYLTDRNDRIINPYTIALDTTSKIVERFPKITTEQTKDPVIQYEKSVAVINSGYVDEYVRVRIDFTESDIQQKTEFTQDGKNWYSWENFCKQGTNGGLNGWHYNASDGYFYYDKIVESGDWAGVSGNGTIELNPDDGHYYYKDGKDEKDIPAAMRTTKLITGIRTNFANYQDMRSYDVIIYNESCPYYFGNDYTAAWNTYKAQQSH